MREMAPIAEMAPGCAKKYKKEILKNPFAPGAISRMITAPPAYQPVHSCIGAASVPLRVLLILLLP